MGSLAKERTVIGWAARDATGVLAPYTYTLRKTGADDVVLKVMYCGICHTDIHQTKNDLGMSKYPMVPGHEVVGEVVEVGPDVTRFRVGELVGVGVIVGCCQNCQPCKSNVEQYCNKRIWSYNDVYTDGTPTHGGFASTMIVNENKVKSQLTLWRVLHEADIIALHFVGPTKIKGDDARLHVKPPQTSWTPKFAVKIPAGLAPEQAAPLLCAGVTVYSPLKHFGLNKPGLKGAILGLGGVGHMGVKIAKAMGHHVSVISSSNKKRSEALDHLGADDYIVSSDVAQMEKAADSLDYIIDTVPVFHPLEPYLSLLKLDGKLILMGVINQPLQFVTPMVMLGRKSITGSFIGSIDETQEMLEFCEKKGLTSTIEVVKMDYVNQAFERLERNDVRYRFVVDVAGSNLDA